MCKTVNGDAPLSITTSRVVPIDTTTKQSSQTTEHEVDDPTTQPRRDADDPTTSQREGDQLMECRSEALVVGGG